MIIKQQGENHRIKNFDGGAISHRLTLPDMDGGNIATTLFIPSAGFSANGIKYDWDETVFVVNGSFWLWREADKSDKVMISTGAHFVVEAGESYNIEVVEDTTMFCVFSVNATHAVVPKLD